MTAKLQKEGHWFIHNLVGHPVAGLVWFIGGLTGLEDLESLGDMIHAMTLPPGEAQ